MQRMLIARHGIEESRMVSVTAKVTPTRKEYVIARAKQENLLSESEFLNRLLDADELRQGCQRLPGDDPAAELLQQLLHEIPQALADQVIDSLERSRLERLTIGAANALVNQKQTA